MRVLRHRTLAFLVAVLAAWGAWEAFVRVSAPGRIDAELQRALGRERLVNVAVTLGFAPEDFHIRVFQDHGVVSGVRGTTVLLNRVPREEVERIARYYWVRRIAPQ
ncbi:MAG: hypothetical protein HY726_01675 [Candidatus Rokubacteria bacterium]|nr:hypothetical protein [Candidatus Rokubacteria bacterium]